MHIPSFDCPWVYPVSLIYAYVGIRISVRESCVKKEEQAALPASRTFVSERSRSACGYAAGVGIVLELDLICSSLQGISINNSSLKNL